jgi:phosphate transport system ATP-binding protein
MSAARAKAEPLESRVAIDARIDEIYYGKFLAVRETHVPVVKGRITGFIGPSGCGKSTVLRSFNRMNDLIPTFRLVGHVEFLGQDIYASNVDPVVVRRYIGMVFQQPNAFSMSIFDNVAFGLRLNRYKGNREDGSSTRCAAPRSGTRSRTSSRRTDWRSPADSSSACVSPARLRLSLRYC